MGASATIAVETTPQPLKRRVGLRKNPHITRFLLHSTRKEAKIAF
jgi:hypothetical protein